MHPQARRHLLKIFKEIVRNSNIQIMITTHSSTFIETEHFENIALVYKTKEKGTKIIQVSKNDLVKFSNETGAAGKSTVENITDFYALTSNERLKEAFFAKKIILVEGDTEELCFPLLLTKAGIDINKRGISVIGVVGKPQIPKYWRLFYKFNIPMLVVFDNDIDKSSNKRNNETIAECFDISVDNIEKIEDSKVFKLINGRFGQKLLIFNNNFETATKMDFEKYCQSNGLNNRYEEFKRESEELGLRKAQKHRYIVKKIIDEFPDYIPEFINEIKQDFIEDQNVFPLQEELK
jgi:putative ATP-dependent endonuclease of OLD family